MTPQDNDPYSYKVCGSGDGITHSFSPSPPFFTLAIEGPNTAVALDAHGSTIVSLHFDDFEDLTSESFREYAAAAVAAVLNDHDSVSDPKDNTTYRPIRTADTTHGDNNTSTFVHSLEDLTTTDVLPKHDLGINLDLELDLDVAFAAALADYEEQTHLTQCFVESTDADLALALSLQEEEEAAADKNHRLHHIGHGGSAWSHNPHNSSFSSVLGTAPGVVLPRHYGTAAISHTEFPSLTSQAAVHKITNARTTPQNTSVGYGGNNNKRPSSSSSSSSYLSSKRVPISTVIAASRSKGVRVINPTTESSSSTTIPSIDNSTSTDDQMTAFGYRRTADQLAVPSAFLDSYEGDAVEARGQALRWVQEAEAAAQGEMTNKKGGGVSDGPSSGAVKRMMEATDGRFKGDNNNDDDACRVRVEYRRNNIRKLVTDMIAAGWRPVPGRGGGHYLYQRFVPPTGHKQILVLPSTPSDPNYILAVHVKLQKMDREAAAVQAAAKAGTARPPR